jgi:neutral ceramidase
VASPSRPCARAGPGARLRAACALALLCAGCTLLRISSEVRTSMGSGPPVEIGAYEVPPAHPQARFSAGAAEVDITPSPGFPTGGHGPSGALAKGYWIRLRARAFFFEDTSGRAAALVAADLFAIGGGLQARVAQLVNQRLAREGLDVSLPPGAIVVAATHTHHSPGNFMTAAVFNQFGSSYSGFSRPLFDFLADRIAQAVVDAAAQARRRPHPVILRLYSGKTGHELSRNRAPRTFLLNVDRERILSALEGDEPQPPCAPMPGEVEGHWADLKGCPRLRAVDRALTVLELVERAPQGDTTAGAMVFFAVHPTALDPGAPLYSPDIFGYASEELKRRWGGAIVGYFNGAEGDVTTRRTVRDLADVAVLGERLARETARIRSGTPTAVESPPVGVSSRLVDVSRKAQRRCGPAALADVPITGTAVFGGAEGDRTILYDLGWRDGVRGKPGDGQGDKMPALDSPLVRPIRLTKDFAPPEMFPRALPLSVVGIGPLRALAVPFEVSTAQGMALREAVGGAGARHGEVELIGVANEFGYYVATEDEYAAQDYMGAATLWGPHQGAFLACSAGRTEPVSSGPVPAREFEPGAEPLEPFGLSFIGDEVHRADDGLDRVLLDPDGAPERRLPWFRWDEPEPCGASPGPEQRGMAQTCRRVSIVQRTPAGWQPFEDDRGTRFFTAPLDKRGRWSAIWLTPLLDRAVRMPHRTQGDAPPPGVTGRFAFVVHWNDRPWRCSEAFDLGRGAALGSEALGEAPCGDYRPTAPTASRAARAGEE